MPHVSPYGTWRSPITASAVASGGVRLGWPVVDGDSVYWLEGRPQEDGRYVVVRRDPAGRRTDVTPSGANVRTRVHEYGGGAFTISDGTIYYANFADQRVYRGPAVWGTAEKPTFRPVTPPGAWRFADFAIDARRQRLVCVREDHTDVQHEAITTLVSIPLDGSESAGKVIASGDDFYSSPCLNPDGSRLAWLSWRHPNMPWDGTMLWVAGVTDSGSLTHAARVAGGPAESVYQPGWSPDGTLYFVSDRDGWWKLYRLDDFDSGESSVRAVVRNPPAGAEFGRPQWVFGTSTWAFAGSTRLVVTYTRAGRWHLAAVDAGGVLTEVPSRIEPSDWIVTTANHAVLVAGSADQADALVRVELNTGNLETLQSSATQSFDSGYISVAEAIAFATDQGQTAFAFHYPPRNQDFAAPPGEAPPLIVISHGGPTAAAKATLDLQVQYWTSRGVH